MREDMRLHSKLYFKPNMFYDFPFDVQYTEIPYFRYKYRGSDVIVTASEKQAQKSPSKYHKDKTMDNPPMHFYIPAINKWGQTLEELVQYLYDELELDLSDIVTI